MERSDYTLGKGRALDCAGPSFATGGVTMYAQEEESVLGPVGEE
jgi:hypothetical protein